MGTHSVRTLSALCLHSIRNTVRYCMVRHGTVWYDNVLRGTVRCCSVACNGAVWYGTSRYDRMLDYNILYYTLLQCMRRRCMVHNNPLGKNLLWRAPCFNGRGNGFATEHCVVASVIPIYCSVKDFGSMTPPLRFLSGFVRPMTAPNDGVSDR